MPVAGKGQAFQAKDIYNSRTAVASRIFNLNEELNNNLVYADFSFGQNLFGMNDNEVTSIEIYSEVSESATENLKRLLGNDFYVKTKLEQNEVLYKMLKTEELAIFLIFSLIIVVALFNMFGALVMVFWKKRQFKNLVSFRIVKRKNSSFVYVSRAFYFCFRVPWRLALGFILLSFQDYFSILSLAPNLPYPVSFELKNFALTFVVVIVVGAVVSYSVSMLIRKNLTKSLQQ